MDEDGEEEEEVVVVEVSTSLSLLFQLLQIVPWYCTHTYIHTYIVPVIIEFKRVQRVHVQPADAVALGCTIEMSVAKNFNYRTGSLSL